MYNEVYHRQESLLPWAEPSCLRILSAHPLYATRKLSAHPSKLWTILYLSFAYSQHTSAQPQHIPLHNTLCPPFACPLHTLYTPSAQPLCVLCIPSAHPLCTPSVHTFCTLYIHPEHTLCIPCAHSVHTLCTLHTQSIHTLFTLYTISAHPLHTLINGRADHGGEEATSILGVELHGI